MAHRPSMTCGPFFWYERFLQFKGLLLKRKQERKKKEKNGQESPYKAFYRKKFSQLWGTEHNLEE